MKSGIGDFVRAKGAVVDAKGDKGESSSRDSEELNANQSLDMIVSYCAIEKWWEVHRF